MIHPSDSSLSLTTTSNKHDKYYIMASLLGVLNFIPVFEPDRGGAAEVGLSVPGLLWLFAGCCVSVPLLLEFAIDMYSMTSSPSQAVHWEDGDHLGPLLMLLSLLLPVITLAAHLQGDDFLASTLSGNSLFSFCQAVALVGMLGLLRLQDTARWNFVTVVPVFALFLSSQVSGGVGLRACEDIRSDDSCFQATDYVVSAALNGLCVLLFAFVARKQLMSWTACLRGSASPQDSTMVASIVFLYLLLRSLVLLCLVGGAMSFDTYYESQVGAHILLVLAAVVLPGRTTKGGLAALKVRLFACQHCC